MPFRPFPVDTQPAAFLYSPEQTAFSPKASQYRPLILKPQAKEKAVAQIQFKGKPFVKSDYLRGNAMREAEEACGPLSEGRTANVAFSS
jgi:hypothetical protein